MDRPTRRKQLESYATGELLEQLKAEVKTLSRETLIEALLDYGPRYMYW